MNYKDHKLELIGIKNVEERKSLIANDLISGVNQFKSFADQEPMLFFELLGGEKENIEPTHSWAREYTYEDYLEDNNEQKVSMEEKENWNLKEKSIENAYETGSWYDTCLVKLVSINGTELIFEFDFCEGYLDEVIRTPYDKISKNNSYGFLMENI